MSLNLSSGAFTKSVTNDYAKKTVAENYMKMYQYAAEDFTSIPDVLTYIETLTAWMEALDARLTEQMVILASHTHILPPHVHPYTDDGHPAITAPSIIPTITLNPMQAAGIRWDAIPYPIYINTTLTLPNLEGNKINISVGSEGSIVPDYRRLKPIPITLVPSITPALKEAATPSLF